VRVLTPSADERAQLADAVYTRIAEYGLDRQCCYTGLRAWTLAQEIIGIVLDVMKELHGGSSDSPSGRVRPPPPARH
jgi:hypothetical protein